MKAIRVRSFGSAEVMQLESVPDLVPGEWQVLVRVGAAGVNPVETYIRAGAYAALPSLPYTPGADAGGTVEAIGRGVTRCQVGDRVYTTGSVTGTYAELAICAEPDVWPLPGQVSLAQGAAIGVPYNTAFKALFLRGQARAGETVLVHGATGGVGLACVQFAASRGLRVLGTGGTAEGRERARQEGAEHMFDHHAPSYADEILAATGGRGVNLVMEMMANVNLATDLKLLARHGRVVIIGSRGKIEIDPRDVMRTEGQILGTLSAAPEERAQAHTVIFEGLEAGKFGPVIGRELPLAQAAEAHTLVMGQKAPGKIVLIP